MRTINDLLTDDNNFMSYEIFQNTFNIKTNLLIYHGLISAIKTHLRSTNAGFLKKDNGPNMPLLLSNILNRDKGSTLDCYLLPSL